MGGRFDIKIANSMVGDIYLYYPAWDYIVGTEGCYNSKNYYLLSNGLSNKGYEEWKSQILETDNTNFFFSSSKKNKEELYFRQRVPASTERSPQSVLIIYVNDVGYMYMEMLGDFIDMGAVEPLDEYLTDEDKDNFLYLDNGVIDRKQYCLPMIVGNVIVMCYNKDILAANGITEVPDNCTWDQFIEICQQIKVGADGSSEVYPLVQRWGNPSMSTLRETSLPHPSFLQI